MFARFRPVRGTCSRLGLDAAGRPGRAAPALRGCLLAATLLAASGCETGPTVAEPVALGPSGRPGATAAERPAPAVDAPSTVVKEVAWPARAEIDEGARAALTPTARAAVAEAAVPVLVPTGADWLARGKVMNGEHWFAYAATGDGLTLSIQGTRLAHRRPSVPQAQGSRRVRGAAAFVGENRRIWTVSWLEHNVAYALDLECAAAVDTRCADEQAALAWAEGLRYVGGRGAETAGGAP
jgi:hypothetical protein